MLFVSVLFFLKLLFSLVLLGILINVFVNYLIILVCINVGVVFLKKRGFSWFIFIYVRFESSLF